MKEFFFPPGLSPWILVLHFLYMQDLIIWYKIGRGANLPASEKALITLIFDLLLNLTA